MTTATPSAGSADEVLKIARDIPIVMFTTVDESGSYVARPMATQQVEDSGDFWFFTERGSRKVSQITANPHVALTLSSGTSWLSVDGTAEVVDEPSKLHELWNGAVSAWLPQGPDDPSSVLIRVSGNTAEYVDTPAGRVATVVSFVKAKVTGKRFEGGEQGRVDFAGS